MKSAKLYAFSRFFLVVLVMLALSVSFAFAKKPVKEPTYSWNVYVSEDSQNLQGFTGSAVEVFIDGVGSKWVYAYDDPETTRNFVNEGYFNFEILTDPDMPSSSEISFNELDLECSEKNACGDMFSVLENPIPQNPYVRIWFGFPGFSGYQYDEQSEGTTVCLARGYFNIDANYVGEPKYYPHPDVISGDFVGDIEDITVTRKSENVWHIQVDIDAEDIVDLEHRLTVFKLECNKRGNVCSPVLISSTIVEKGTAESIKFDLYFVREIVNE